MAGIEFTAFARATEGRGASRRMRRAGKAPGVVYGSTDAPQSIELDHNALHHALKSEAFHSSILTMELDGAATKVLLRDVQMHPFRNEVLHVDFQRVDENKKIHMKVPLHFINGDASPAVKEAGAIVSHVTTELDIICLPRDLPAFIEVDLSALDLGSPVHVSALHLPPGVKASPRKTDPVVAAAVVPKAHVEEVEAVVAEGAEAGAEVVAATADGKPVEAKPGDAKAPADKKEAPKDDKKASKDDKKK